MKYICKCNKHDKEGTHAAGRDNQEPVSASFYVLETEYSAVKGRDANTGKRWRVDAECPVDFVKVAEEFGAKGRSVSVAELKEAYA